MSDPPTTMGRRRWLFLAAITAAFCLSVGEGRAADWPQLQNGPARLGYGNVQSVGGGCLIVGDRLYFYASGRNATQETTGVAFLRRDGFASMEAGASVGTLTTRPVRFSGKHLFVNVDCPEGKLCAEILDDQGQVIGPFSAVNCQPVSADKTLQAVRWQDAEDLSAVSGRPVRFRFQLTNGKLYAFWVSPTPDGASHGYLAAGGPGYPGPVDTIGMVPR